MTIHQTDGGIPHIKAVTIMRIMFLNKAPKSGAVFDPTEIEKLLNSYASSGTTVELGFPDNFEGSRVEQVLGEQMMLNGLDHMLEVPALVRKMVWAAENGYDAIIQSNTFDPGVDAGRLTVGIPVLGPFRTTLHIATNLADKIGILVPLPAHVPYTWRLLRSYGMESFVTAIRPLGVYGTKLKGQREEITTKAAKIIEEIARETGAHACIPLGGALIPYIVDPDELQRRSGIHVYNTKSITIRVAELCVGLGLSHSPLTYPRAKLSYSDFFADAEPGA